jgi:predicted ester cyclase
MKNMVRSVCLIAFFAMAAVALAEQALPTPRSIILTAGQEQAAQAVILAARRYAAFWNTGEASYAEAALAGNFADRTLPSGRPQGIKGVLEASKNFRAAIPDLRAEIEELLVVNDRAVVRYIFTGHFTGRFKDLKGDGREISFRAVDIYRVQNGTNFRQLAPGGQSLTDAATRRRKTLMNWPKRMSLRAIERPIKG